MSAIQTAKTLCKVNDPRDEVITDLARRFEMSLMMLQTLGVVPEAQRYLPSDVACPRR